MPVQRELARERHKEHVPASATGRTSGRRCTWDLGQHGGPGPAQGAGGLSLFSNLPHLDCVEKKRDAVTYRTTKLRVRGR